MSFVKMDLYKRWYQIDIIIYTGIAFYYTKSARWILLMFLVKLFLLELSSHSSPASSLKIFNEKEYEKKFPLKFKAKGDVPNSTTCSICTEDFNGKGMYRSLDCQHEFHPECIDHWVLKCKSNCPLCRTIF